LFASSDNWKIIRPLPLLARAEEDQTNDTPVDAPKSDAKSDDSIEQDLDMIFTKLSSENASKLFESTDRGKIFYLYRGDSNERMTVV
jgi:hypothetical protein